MDARVKAVRIKAGVVKRVAREAVVYRQEAEAQKERADKAEAAKAEPHVLKHNQQLLDEALMMIPDADRRLKKAHFDLKELLEAEVDIRDTEEYHKASKILEDSTKQIAAYEKAAQ